MVMMHPGFDVSGQFRGIQNITADGDDHDLPVGDGIGIIVGLTQDVERPVIRVVMESGEEGNLPTAHGDKIFARIRTMKSTTAGTSAGLYIAVMKF